MITAPDIIEVQKMVCAKYCAPFHACADDERVGVAVTTLKCEPIYGVRRTNEDGSACWYIWGGPRSTATDFYQPLCAGHISDLIPMVLPYLALPPGYKFIIDRNGFEDVWFENEEGEQPMDVNRP